MKYLTTPKLIEANRMAEKNKYSCSLTGPFLMTLDPRGYHLVRLSFIPNDSEIRAEILCKQEDTMEPAVVQLDMEPGFFNSLPDHESLKS